MAYSGGRHAKKGRRLDEKCTCRIRFDSVLLYYYNDTLSLSTAPFAVGTQVRSR